MTFTASFSIQPPTLGQRFKQWVQPPPFSISEHGLKRLLPEYHHNAAMKLLTLKHSFLHGTIASKAGFKNVVKLRGIKSSGAPPVRDRRYARPLRPLGPIAFDPRHSSRLDLRASHLQSKTGGMPSFKKPSVTLYYPGCGQDLVWPILMIHNIAPSARHWIITGQDTASCMGAFISTMQTLSRNPVYSAIYSDIFRLNKGGEGARFRFQDRIVDILFSQSDALEDIPSHLENDGYDIYFERGFEFCRSQSPGFIEGAVSHLKPGGMVITDHAFSCIPHGLTSITPPKKNSLPAWGFYKHPAVYKKR